MAFVDGRSPRWLPAHGALLLAALGAVLVGPSCGSAPGTPDDGAGSGSSSTGTEQPCTPGAVQACPCVGGDMGAQTCNPQGIGFGACDCPGTTMGTTMGTTTVDGTTTEIDVSTSPADETATTTGGPTGSTSSSGSGSSTEEGPTGYGPCFNGDGDCMLPGEICVGSVGGSPQTFCSVQECESAADCPPSFGGATAMPECSDITGNDIPDCFLSCEMDDECPMGMVCFLEAGPACIWPEP